MAGLNRLAGKVAVVTGAAVFTLMLTLGMFEKYPRMKCAVLEAGAHVDWCMVGLAGQQGGSA